MRDIFFEHLVKRKPKGYEQILKYSLIILTVLLILSGFFYVGLLLPAGIVLGIVGHFLIYPRLEKEYEYSYVNGEFDIDVIYSRSKRRHEESFSVVDVECAAPLGSHQLEAFQHDYTVTDYSAQDPDVRPYVFVFAGKKRLIYMEIEDEELIADLKRRLPRRFFTE